ncbi:MAG: hypothetical protein WC472_01605 [Candidatus Paceibacterota bacterium]
MSKATTIKNKIKTYLEEIKALGIIGEVQVDDLKQSTPFDRDFGAYPAVVVTSPSITSEALTNSDNLRTYTFALVVVVKAEDVESETEVEDLVENILNKFDDDITFGGEADGGVEPSASNPEPITIKGKSLIVFSIIIKAKASYAI